MGQKTHPLGFRLVTTQKSKSVWFSNFKTYSKLLNEDHKIRNVLETHQKVAGITNVIISRNGNGNKIKVDIYAARPGILVGSSGSNLAQIYKDLQAVIHVQNLIILNVIEVQNPDTQANLIADFIAEQLEKRIAFRRAMRKAIKRTQLANVPGIKVQVSGRLNGAEIARSEWAREGRVPLQTLRADIDYAHKEAHTIYGVLGIKVWLFKGEVIR